MNYYPQHLNSWFILVCGSDWFFFLRSLEFHVGFELNFSKRYGLPCVFLFFFSTLGQMSNLYCHTRCIEKREGEPEKYHTRLRMGHILQNSYWKKEGYCTRFIRFIWNLALKSHLILLKQMCITQMDTP